MTCQDVAPLVEAIAAGELEVADDLRAHLESCPGCAAALAAARRIDLLLRGREAPEPPARFTPMVLARIRDDRWQIEQRVDRIFNVAMVAGALIVVAGLAALTNVRAVLDGSAWVFAALATISADAMQAAAPNALTYVSAAGLLMSALLMWWWAERRLSID